MAVQIKPVIHRIGIIAYFILFTFSSPAQPAKLWDNIATGPYAVGYQDTVIFDQSITYDLGAYHGAKPFFISMWFPAQSSKGKHMTFSDYMGFDKNKVAAEVIDSVREKQYQSFLKYGFYSQDFLLEHESSLPAKNEKALVKTIFQSEVKAKKTSEFPSSKHPVIVYHHGRGGISWDNHVMFEYLASHGFVVISAYYHWPGDDKYTHEQALENVEFVAEFARNLPFADQDQLYYMGHSWGGSTGLRMNHKGTVAFKRYIILDSTIEHMGLEEFRINGGAVTPLFRHEPEKFITPTTVFSARSTYLEARERVYNPYPSYLPFQYLNPAPFSFFTLKEPLNHGAFTSLALIRLITGDLKGLDADGMRPQMANYQNLVKLVYDVLEGIQPRGDNYLPFDLAAVREEFDVFLYRFATQPSFQKNRAKFPVEVIRWKDPQSIGYSVGVDNVPSEQWTHEPIFANQALLSQVFNNHSGSIDETDERLFQWIGIENGVSIKYFFNLIDNKWYLTRKVNLGQ